MSETIRISEIFGPTLQGEGALIGQPTVFVRTGGCDYRCSWCDTLYAVESKHRQDWTPMSTKDIFAKVTKLSDGTPLTITLSGGNPATQNLAPLIDLGKRKGYRFAMETQGSIAQDWFAGLDILTLSPKPPSSGMKTDWNSFDACLRAAGNKPKTVLKIVVLDEEDYVYAQEASARYPQLDLYLQPCNPQVKGKAPKNILDQRLRWLTEKVLADGWFAAHILPQLHIQLWGNERGV